MFVQFWEFDYTNRYYKEHFAGKQFEWKNVSRCVVVLGFAWAYGNGLSAKWSAGWLDGWMGEGTEE